MDDVVDAAPCAGEMFVLRHKNSGRTFAVNDDGDVRLAFLDNVETIFRRLTFLIEGARVDILKTLSDKSISAEPKD